MAKCFHCDNKIEGLPFKCKFCKEIYCSDCRLPEKHNCYSLSKRNVFNNLQSEKFSKDNKFIPLRAKDILNNNLSKLDIKNVIKIFLIILVLLILIKFFISFFLKFN